MATVVSYCGLWVHCWPSVREPHRCEPNLPVPKKTEPGDTRGICFHTNKMGRSAPASEGTQHCRAHRRHPEAGAVFVGMPHLL